MLEHWNFNQIYHFAIGGIVFQQLFTLLTDCLVLFWIIKLHLRNFIAKLLIITNFNGTNWIDHQGVDNISSLKTLSLCKGKLLTDLIRDLQKQQYEQQSPLRAFGYNTLKYKRRHTLFSLKKTYKNVLGFSLYIWVFYLNPNMFK